MLPGRKNLSRRKNRQRLLDPTLCGKTNRARSQTVGDYFMLIAERVPIGPVPVCDSRKASIENVQ
ncbi:MAG: hypothetical protein ABS69_20230 [Nitrosomonadales bacterium SCN 54-20]|nr:MAG: hypothetical protein ABS69_20230 [Nitrosomonadales bacterium SCN 54-20]